MRENILNRISIDSILYYKEFFEDKLSNLSPYEDFQNVLEILSKEEERSHYYFATDQQANFFQQ